MKESFKGKVTGITKVDTEEGQAVKCTLEGGFYFDVSLIKDKELFKRLCQIDLGKMVTVKVEV